MRYLIVALLISFSSYASSAFNDPTTAEKQNKVRKFIVSKGTDQNRLVRSLFSPYYVLNVGMASNNFIDIKIHYCFVAPPLKCK